MPKVKISAAKLQKAAQSAVQSLQGIYTDEKQAEMVFDSYKKHRTFKGKILKFGGLITTSNKKWSKKAKGEAWKLYKTFIAMPANTIVFWVVCMGGGMSGYGSTHCNGFIFNKATNKLHFFDPGVATHSHVADLNDIFDVFKHIFPTASMGSYFQLELQCSLDTYCQSWSLMWLCMYRLTGNFKFTDVWRKYSPGDNRQRIGQFMLDHVMAPFLDPNDYRYYLLERWWSTMRVQYKYDVYWDNDNLQSMIPLARLGFLWQNLPGEIIFIHRPKMNEAALIKSTIQWPQPPDYYTPVSTLFSCIKKPISRQTTRNFVRPVKAIKAKRKKSSTSVTPPRKKRKLKP